MLNTLLLPCNLSKYICDINIQSKLFLPMHCGRHCFGVTRTYKAFSGLGSP